VSAQAETRTGQAERQWWLRLFRVLTAPSSVFVWLRDDSAEAANARQEPITAVVFLAGVSIFLSTRTAGRLSYRQGRHVTGLATIPWVLALVFVWPVRLAMFGADAFRSGGSDHGPAEAVFRTIDIGLLVWSAVLVYLGVRALNGWSWARSLAGCAVAAVVFALIVLLFVAV
jgi:hypothetical protein